MQKISSSDLTRIKQSEDMSLLKFNHQVFIFITHLNIAASTLQNTATVVSHTVTGLVASNLAMTMFSSFSVQKLWMMINALEIIVSYPLLKIPIPSNLFMLLDGIKEMSNMNLIPPEYTTDLLGKFI